MLKAAAAVSILAAALSVLAIRMDDGRMQYIDTASDVPVGSRVQLTPDHKIMVQ